MRRESESHSLMKPIVAIGFAHSRSARWIFISHLTQNYWLLLVFGMQIDIFSVSTVSNAQPMLFRSNLSGFWFANLLLFSYWIFPRCLRRCHLFHFVIEISIRYTNSHHSKYIPEDGAKMKIIDWYWTMSRSSWLVPSHHHHHLPIFAISLTQDHRPMPFHRASNKSIIVIDFIDWSQSKNKWKDRFNPWWNRFQYTKHRASWFTNIFFGSDLGLFTRTYSYMYQACVVPRAFVLQTAYPIHACLVRHFECERKTPSPNTNRTICERERREKKIRNSHFARGEIQIWHNLV